MSDESENRVRAEILAAVDILNALTNPCEYRDHPEGLCEGTVDWRPARTAYHWKKESGEENPNRDKLLCDEHYKMYSAYWDEMWAEYYYMVRS